MADLLAVHRTHLALSELSLVDALTVAARHQPLEVPASLLLLRSPAAADARLRRLNRAGSARPDG